MHEAVLGHLQLIGYFYKYLILIYTYGNNKIPQSRRIRLGKSLTTTPCFLVSFTTFELNLFCSASC